MNIDKEMKLFLYEIDGHGYIFENMKWLGNCFEDNFLNMAWELWLASANRDGYKLVPVELSTESIKKLDDRFIEVVVKDDEDYQDLYKAMIGAAE